MKQINEMSIEKSIQEIGVWEENNLDDYLDRLSTKFPETFAWHALMQEVIPEVFHGTSLLLLLEQIKAIQNAGIKIEDSEAELLIENFEKTTQFWRVAFDAVKESDNFELMENQIIKDAQPNLTAFLFVSIFSELEDDLEIEASIDDLIMFFLIQKNIIDSFLKLSH